MHAKRKLVWIKDDHLRLRGVINANRGSGGWGVGGEIKHHNDSLPASPSTFRDCQLNFLK